MQLIELRIDQIPAYMQEMQEAFQKGYEAKFGASNELVLPFSDIRESLHAPHAIAYEVIEGEERLGGAIVAFSDDGEHGDLHFLYTRVGMRTIPTPTTLTSVRSTQWGAMDSSGLKNSLKVLK